MLLNIVIDYIVLDVARSLGLLEELLDYTNKLAITWEPEYNYIEQINIKNLAFKVRPIYAERTNSCEIRIEVLG